jgi:hypothetical protein
MQQRLQNFSSDKFPIGGQGFHESPVNTAVLGEFQYLIRHGTVQGGAMIVQRVSQRQIGMNPF